MPFVDIPSPPASTQPVYLHPSLRGLPVPAYFALVFVLIATLAVLVYVAYNAYHKMTLNDNIATLQSKQSTEWRARPFKHRPAGSDTKFLVDRKTSVYDQESPPITVPCAAVSRSHYDMHNIRFASPSVNLAVFHNPKLAPVAGSAVPLSYDSRENLFPNPFAPVHSSAEKYKKAKSTPASSKPQRLGSIKVALKSLRKPGKENVNFQMLSGDWE
ncbi:hypothetical protein C8F01DRAFT_1135600 [Mycena amicta]|nr:hypothetical protein C8F01DRAFT_1135600 [Mycena amicta]